MTTVLPKRLTPAQLIDYVRSKAPALGLDSAAALSVATREGLGGTIGDANTSFGPWQLHIGGELPANIAAQGPMFAQQWAWSQVGIDYALGRMASVAGGQTGPTAIQSIVTGFERPRADLVPGEIAGATAAYSAWRNGGIPGGIIGPTPVPGAGNDPAPSTTFDPSTGAAGQIQVGASSGGVKLADTPIGPFSIPSGLLLGVLAVVLLLLGAMLFAFNVKARAIGVATSAAEGKL